MTAFPARWLTALKEAAGLRAFVIAAGAGVFLGLTGPFGTSQAALWLRLVYWLVMAELGTVIGVLTATTVAAVMAPSKDPAAGLTFLVAGLTAAIMTLPGTVVVWLLTHIFFQGPHGMGSSGDFIGFIPPVFVISLAMTAVNALANRAPQHTHAYAATETSPPSSPPRFIERLPQKLWGAEVHAVEAEDHYLRLHTSRGSDLILMRLSDAIAELEGIEGAQTHRSWWVARAAVRGARRLDGRAVLELPGGIEAPVSRGYVRALKTEGWF